MSFFRPTIRKFQPFTRNMSNQIEKKSSGLANFVIGYSSISFGIASWYGTKIALEDCADRRKNNEDCVNSIGRGFCLGVSKGLSWPIHLLSFGLEKIVDATN